MKKFYLPIGIMAFLYLYCISFKSILDRYWSANSDTNHGATIESVFGSSTTYLNLSSSTITYLKR